MGFLERQIEKSKARTADWKEYQQWLENNPSIKKEVDRLNDESILAEQRAGVATVIALPMLLVSPLAALGFVAESGRQWHKGFKALNERDNIIRENSPRKKP